MRVQTMFLAVFSAVFAFGACVIDARDCETGDVTCIADDDDDATADDDTVGDDDTGTDNTCDGENEYRVSCTAPEGATRVRACGNFMAGDNTADQRWNCTSWQNGNVFTWCGTVLPARLSRSAGCPGNQCGLEFSVEYTDASHWLCMDAPSNQMETACTVDGPSSVLIEDADNGQNGCHGHLTSG